MNARFISPQFNDKELKIEVSLDGKTEKLEYNLNKQIK